MTKRAVFTTKTVIWLKYILPFLMIMLMSLIVGVVIYQRTSSVLEEEVKNSNRVLLEQGMNVMDNQLKALSETIRKMTNDSKMWRLQLISDPFNSENLYRVIEAKQRLQDYPMANDVVLNYYVMFKNSGLVLNSDLIARLPEVSQMLKFPDKDKNFLNELVNRYHFGEIVPDSHVMLNGRTYSTISYLQSFGFSDYSTGTVMALLDTNEIRKLLGGVNIKDGWAYILDDKGQLLVSNTGDDERSPGPPFELSGASGVMNGKLGDKDMIVTYVTSSYNGWTYVAAQPTEVVLGKIMYIKKMTIIVLFLFILFAALIALYFSYRNSKPVQALLQMVSRYSTEPMESGGHTLGRIQHTVSRIIQSNEELQAKMEEQLPFLRASFFERLLRGQFSFESDMLAVMRNLRLDWNEGDSLLVAILTFPAELDEYSSTDVERLHEKKLLVREVIRLIMPDGLYLHEVDDDKIALIFHFPLNDKEEVYRSTEQKLTFLQIELNRMYGIATLISAGGMCSRWSDVSRSFLEARHALVRSRESGIVWHKDMGTYRNHYVYPENMETRLIHSVRTGNEEALQLLWGELYRENFVTRDLPVWMLRVFVYDLLGSIIKLTSETTGAGGGDPFPTGMPEMDSAKSIEAHFGQLKKQALAMCRTVNESRQSRQRQRFEDIIRYIDEHYEDAQLSLAQLADKFEVSETYLSRAFKENTGINFFEYLETRRIERSKSLLRETELAVGEIALSVGYGSSNTFARAFKRSVGISARDFRQKSRAE